MSEPSHTALVQNNSIPLSDELRLFLSVKQGAVLSLVKHGCGDCINLVISNSDAGGDFVLNNDRIRPISLKTRLNNGDIYIVRASGRTGILLEKKDIEVIEECEEDISDQFGTPVPPGWLRQRAVGHTNISSFIESGTQIANRFSDIALDCGLDVRSMSAIVDFGCSCGRVLRGFHGRTNAKLYGCDIDQPAISWIQRKLSRIETVQSSEWPPVNIPEQTADMLYAISVVTHLDELHQKSWLSEWFRILRPGGLALISYRSEDAMPKFPHAAGGAFVEELRRNGVHFEITGYFKGIFPDFYQGAFHTHKYVRETWGQLFEVQKLYRAGEVLPSQDLAVLRKPRDCNSTRE